MGTEVEIVKLLAPGGAFAILAYLMFLLYRKDAAKWGEDHKERAEIMTNLVEKTTATVANNTAVIVHLAEYLKNGRDRERA
jgi:hypothetical protein